MSALTKSAIEPVTTPREPPPNLSVMVPAAEEQRCALFSLACMLIACAVFAGALASSVLIPAIRTLMGT